MISHKIPSTDNNDLADVQANGNNQDEVSSAPEVDGEASKDLDKAQATGSKQKPAKSEKPGGVKANGSTVKKVI